MIEVAIDDGIAIVTMRHGKANALDIELCDALTEAFEDLCGDEAQAVVLTGQGRMFSAGVDLIRLDEGGADYVREFLPALARLCQAAFYHPKPVVAAVNGHAIAGGCILACCADRRIMAREAGRIGVTELLVGVPFPALAFEVLRFAVPPRRLAEFTLGGETYAADAALERGWVDALTAPDALMDEAVATARKLAALPPAAFVQTKRQIRQAVIERVAATGAAIDAVVTDIWCSDEALAAVRDYVAKTLKKGHSGTGGKKS
jgi:enoyl-CoA hydratase